MDLQGEIDVTLPHDPATCDPLGGQRCLLPFPNDYFTVADDSTATGRRVNFAAEATPANVNGVHIDPTELNRNDGFSPGSAITVLLPGIDPAASGAAPVTDMGRSLDRDAPIAPTRMVLYGHSLLGSARSVHDYASLYAGTTNTTFCSTWWTGMSEDDIGQVFAVLRDMSGFRTVPDRLQQSTTSRVAATVSPPSAATTCTAPRSASCSSRR